MKNVFVAMAVTLGLVACGAGDKIDIKPDTSGSGGNTTMGNGGSAGNGDSCLTCDADSVEGSRLKSQWIHGEDGSKIRKADLWTDTQLNMTCSFQELPNGETRCVPPHNIINTFLDPQCSTPFFLRASKCITVPSYARVDHYAVSQDTACGPDIDGSAFYKVGIAMPNNPLNYWGQAPDGSCDGKGGPPPGTTAYYATPTGLLSDFVLANVD